MPFRPRARTREGKAAAVTRKPAFKMVLTAVGDYAYTRKEDGTIVCFRAQKMGKLQPKSLDKK